MQAWTEETSKSATAAAAVTGVGAPVTAAAADYDDDLDVSVAPMRRPEPPASRLQFDVLPSPADPQQLMRFPYLLLPPANGFRRRVIYALTAAVRTITLNTKGSKVFT